MNDYAEISQLVARERQYRVRHVKELADCYYPDATIQTSWQSGSVASFINGQPTEVSDQTMIVGRMSIPTIHQNGQRAYVEFPTTTYMWLTVNGAEAELESFRRLIYHVEKRNGVWKIAAMISINESDNLHPAIPGTDLKVDPKDLVGLRRSYRYLAYTRKNAGGEISPDLLGIDRPDDIKRLYAQAEDWINE
ncbi:nuclear transport factor 2 family protein [Loigolactobacillus iwatensis]|uniref:nuclear transport factor 2 family protein n=1 Tax=Loigolactobacillus iwatensis TaxID=1267156 RepID=UPI000F7EB4E6|nr:nuclear transport factor 2 family protein [Loigolactobacillus iwatensis]